MGSFGLSWSGLACDRRNAVSGFVIMFCCGAVCDVGSGMGSDEDSVDDGVDSVSFFFSFAAFASLLASFRCCLSSFLLLSWITSCDLAFSLA